MRKTEGTLLLMIAALLFALMSTVSCSKDLEEIVTNIDPSCQITNPVNGLQVIQGEVVTVIAEASDTDGSIARVNFFVDDVFIESDDSAPYTFDWDTSNELPGDYVVKALSDDGIGISEPSEIIVIIKLN